MVNTTIAGGVACVTSVAVAYMRLGYVDITGRWLANLMLSCESLCVPRTGLDQMERELFLFDVTPAPRPRNVDIGCVHSGQQRRSRWSRRHHRRVRLSLDLCVFVLFIYRLRDVDILPGS